MADIVIGTIVAVLVGLALWKTVRSMRNNTCPGCAGGCSASQRKACASNHEPRKNP